jgi:hypothetical protein
MRRVDLDRLTPPQLRLLDRAAAEIRGDFNALIDGLYPEDGSDLLLHGTLSRSPFVSGLFLDCCRLALVESLLAGEGFDELVVEAGPLADAIESRLLRDGSPARVSRRAGSPLRRLRPFGRLAKAAFRYFRRWAAGFSAPKPDSSVPLTLLDIFLLEDSCRDGKLRDRYYSGWQEFLAEAERSSVYYLPELPEAGDPGKLIASAVATGERFLFKERYLRASDYFAAMLAPLRGLPGASTPRTFRGFDAAPLIQEDARLNAWNSQTLAGILNRRLVRRLKEAGVALRLVVDWSENQLLDRGLVLGVRENFPGVPVFGYAGYVIAPARHPYAHPTRRERAARLVPDRLFAVGRGLVDGLKEFCPELDAAAAPAFRFRGVWRERAARPDPAKPTILLALPISPQGALDVLTLAAAATLPAGFENARFAVKAHPALPPDELRRLFPGAWPAALEFVVGNFADLAEAADLLISNTSSVCAEALALGVPVVVAGSSTGLTENPIPAWVPADVWRLAYSPEEMSRAYSDLLTKDPTRLKLYAEIGRRVREECFEPVDEAGVRRLFQLRTKT